MLVSTITTIFFAAALSAAAPLNPRLVTLDPEATKEAQQRDGGATRAFTGTEIKTSDGRCLLVQNGSGDFRNNLNPVELGNCDGSDGQKWDVITKGKHNDQQGVALIVNGLTQACLNFDPRRAAGNTVIMFSCGGRADGEGLVTDSQLFPFTGGAGPLSLSPANSKGATCLTVAGNVIDQAPCDANNAGEKFTFGNAASAPPPPPAETAAPPPPAPTDAPAPAPPPTATGPLPVSRAGGTLNPTDAAESHQRDDTATRALSGVPIKTSDGQCLSINPLAGDFRQNLIPVDIKACDGSDGQKFDVITKGKHNDRDGFALIVSSLTQGCLNFDDRRADGDRVLLFSCGGRADGEGQVTDSQLFPFTGANGAITLAPANARGSTCLAPINGKLDAAGCNAGANDQLFAIGNAPATGNEIKDVTTAAPAPVTTEAPAATPPTATTGRIPVSGAGKFLNPTAAAESQQRDDTATRALSGVPIKTSDGSCLSVNPFAGNFRQNQIPVEVKVCDGSDNQKFDVITKGKHINQDGFALIVSALTQGCLKFDDRKAPGNKVNLFSCGGRADGNGKTTNSQFFPFTGGNGPITFAPANAKGKTCLAPVNGVLDAVNCAAGAKDQQFTFGEGSAAPAPAPAPAPTSEAAAPTVAATTEAPAVTTPTATGPIAVSRAGVVLNPTAAAEANQRDNGATRALSGVPIKASNGQCLSIDPLAGDFRQNLIPVELKACDGSDGQKFDVITKGKHNDRDGFALFVSSLTQGCLNFDDRRADGDKVILFSCGGRADGEGLVTDSQLFPFKAAGANPLAPANARGASCLVPKNGKLDVENCNSASPSATELFTIA